MKRMCVMLRRWMRAAMPALMAFALTIVPLFALSEPIEATKTQIKNLKIMRQNGGHINNNEININSRIRLYFEWDSSAHGTSLKAGDYFIVRLPDEFVVENKAGNISFPLRAPAPDDDKIAANALVTPGPGGAGGSIKITFTNYVEDRHNVHGEVYLHVFFNKTLWNVNIPKTISISIGTFSGEITITPLPPPAPYVIPPDEHLSKWSGGLDGNGNIQWRARINYAGDGTLTNATLKDELSTADPGGLAGIHYIDDATSFILKKGSFTQHGQFTPDPMFVPRKLHPVFNADRTSFSCQLGNIANGQYFLEYKSTYVQGSGLVVKNKMTLLQNDKTWIATSQFTEFNGSGHGEGNLDGKIRIIKVEKNKPSIKLANAVFEVKRVGSSEAPFTLTTGAGGEVLSGGLATGEYIIKEITAPPGYLLNNEEHRVQVIEGATAVITADNTKISTSVHATKQWVGGPLPRPVIYFKLFRRIGTEAHQPVPGAELKRLDSGVTSVTWTNLEKTDQHGNPYKFSVRETDASGTAFTPENYIKLEECLVVKNTYNSPKINIPVEKHWMGGQAASSVTVRLHANGIFKEQGVLNQANGWRHVFANLDKFDSNGAAILYTVEEILIPGYTSNISRNSNSDISQGFRIVNTRKTGEVTAVKSWINGALPRPTIYFTLYRSVNGAAAEAVPGADIKRLDNGVDSVTWTGLPETDIHGNVYHYSVRETDAFGNDSTPENYKKQENGLSVTNRFESPKISIPVEKIWEGKKGDKVLVYLKADGVRKTSIELHEGNGWKGRFDHLDKLRADGTPIVYSVEEEEMQNYVVSIYGSPENGFVLRNKRIPGTGDAMRPVLYAFMLIAAGAGLMLSGTIRKNKTKRIRS